MPELLLTYRMKTEKHVIKLPERTGICEIVEHPERIIVKLHFSKTGDFDDGTEIALWVLSILEAYDNDPRPVEIGNFLLADAALAASKGKMKLAALLVAMGQNVDDWRSSGSAGGALHLRNRVAFVETPTPQILRLSVFLGERLTEFRFACLSQRSAYGIVNDAVCFPGIDYT